MPAYTPPPSQPLHSIMPMSGVGVDLTNEVLPGTLVSASVNPNLIQMATVTIPASAIKTLYDTSVVVIPAVSGKTINVIQAILRYTEATAQFTSGGAVQLQYGSAHQAGGTAVLTTVAASVILSASSSDTAMVGAGSTLTASNGSGIYASCATGNFAGATAAGTITFFVWYQVV